MRHAIAASLSALTLAACAPAFAEAPVATTASGKVEGAVDHGIVSWKGIPFAAPPVGELRWRAPQPAAPWQGVREATAYGHDCMQKPFPSDAAPLGTPPAEDCLYLNVWKPEHATATKKLPVVLWIYGGGFVNGGSSPPTYSGAALAKKGVMVVSFNYRLGRFGTFAHPALTKADADSGLLGNYGTLDQVAALKWVRANIAAFGGDPANVTLIGESAGGMSVHMLLTSPLAQGLFARAVVMSGGDGGGMSAGAGGLPAAEGNGQAFAATKGIAADDPQALTRLRALPAEDVVDGLNLASLFGAPHAPFSMPFADGRIAVDAKAAYAAGRFAKVPVMIGATSGDFGGPQGAMIKGARDIATTLTAAGVPVYAYRFSYVASSLEAKEAGHASDIPFFFDTQHVKYGDKTTARDDAMGAAISDALVAFAKTGNPGAPWPKYDPAKDVIVDFATDGTAHVGRDPLTR